MYLWTKIVCDLVHLVQYIKNSVKPWYLTYLNVTSNILIYLYRVKNIFSENIYNTFPTHLCCNRNNGNDINTYLSITVFSHTGLNCTTRIGAVNKIKPVSSSRALQADGVPFDLRRSAKLHFFLRQIRYTTHPT